MTTSDAAEKQLAVAAAEPPVATDVPAHDTDASAPVEPEAAIEKGDAQPVGDAPKKRGRKRKVSVTEDKVPSGADETSVVADGAADAAVTENAGGIAAEKPPKEKKSPVAKKPKAAKAAAAPATPTKRKPGRPRKIVKEESEDEDETESELRKRVEALPEDVKAKFGTIVWAKMVGFPFWPALITDPRLLHPKLHASALKEIDTKFFVCFYQSNDFSSVLFKNIEVWDDTKHDYRAGHPVKDAKAPKRRSMLMVAIEQADKDAPLPVDERMNGLMKVVPEEEESSAEQEEKPVVQKRKPGRPVGSKNKPKPAGDLAVSGDAASSAPAPKAKRGRKKSVEVDHDDSTAKVTTPETPEEEEPAPPLSKDEIKAKVASRKTPSKKKAATTEEKSAVAVAKMAAKSAAKSEPAAKSEVDSKRKKEIELVVPRKSVKSADIREATEEAARKKPGPREKPKDKGEYKVGNLTQFAGKMNRLFANESSKNNDELILLLTQLFEEKMVYRSDVERSGVAAVIAVLRKSSNPTVAQTASAVRKHLMKVLNDDVSEPASKKQKAEADPESKASKKQKTSSPSASPTPAATEAIAIESTTREVSQENGSSETATPVEEEPSVEETVPAVTSSGMASPAPVDENTPSPTQQPPASTPTRPTAGDSAKQEPAKPTSPVKADPAPELVAPLSPFKADPLPVATEPKPDPSGDKGRMNCIEMLKRALAPIGERSAEIAREIEARVFERFSESIEEYQACARSITFGLKKNAGVRERLKIGDLHALELAYTPEQILNA